MTLPWWRCCYDSATRCCTRAARSRTLTWRSAWWYGAVPSTTCSTSSVRASGSACLPSPGSGCQPTPERKWLSVSPFCWRSLSSCCWSPRVLPPRPSSYHLSVSICRPSSANRLDEQQYQHSAVVQPQRQKVNPLTPTGVIWVVGCNELTHFLIVLNVTVTVTQAYRHLKYCARLQMNYLVKLFPTLTMFCTLCCRRYLQHLNITILDVGRTHIHFLDRTVICVTATS